MKVDLRPAQVRMLVEWMGSTVVRDRDCLLPAVAWRDIVNAMKSDGYGPLGGHRKDRPRAFFTTMSEIQVAVMRSERHPAMEAVGVLGVATDVIPAWRLGQLRYSPYPADGCPFVVLVPRVSEVFGHTITEWVVGNPPDDSDLWDPATHSGFVMT